MPPGPFTHHPSFHQRDGCHRPYHITVVNETIAEEVNLT